MLSILPRKHFASSNMLVSRLGRAASFNFSVQILHTFHDFAHLMRILHVLCSRNIHICGKNRYGSSMLAVRVAGDGPVAWKL